MKNKPEFRASIEERLDELEWSPKQLAREAGLVYNTVRRYLLGETDISADRLEQICEVLGLDLFEVDQ